MVGERLLLDSPTSAGWYSVALPLPQAEIGRLTYTTDRLTLVAEPAACAIPEYRDRLPNRVTLHWDSGSFEGCNGRGRLPGSVAGTTWELVRIDDDPAPAGRSPPATLIFGTNGSLGGTLACNDGGIRTTWTGSGGFVAHGEGFESTAMGCNDPAVEDFGRRFWNGLITARSWRHDMDRVYITFADGTEAELRFLL